MTGQWFRHASGQVTQSCISFSDVPVVVIDPEDAQQVDRLRRLILGPLATAHPLDDFADALRQFANPTPLKPEPVVTDAEARAMRKALARLARQEGMTP